MQMWLDVVRIIKVQRFTHGGCLGDFMWPSELHDFAGLNLIYGWNGTGKTSISRFFRSLQLAERPAACTGTIETDNAVLSSDAFPSSDFAIRVFNREFVDRVVLGTEGRDVPFIFVVGEENAELQQELDKLRVGLSRDTERVDQLDSAARRSQKALERHCADHASQVKERLRSAGSKNKYNNFNRSDYQEAMKRLAGDSSSAHTRLSSGDRRALERKILTQPMDVLRPAAYRSPDLAGARERVVALLGCTAASDAIDQLRADPPVEGWVEKGLGLHRSRRSDSCLFCAQPLPPDRLARLGAHFNDAYVTLVEALENELSALASADAPSFAADLPREGALYPDLHERFSEGLERVSSVDAAVRRCLAELKEALTLKRSSLHEPQELGSVEVVDTAEAVALLNACVEEHNDRCRDFDREVSAARHSLAQDHYAASLDQYNEVLRASVAAEADHGEARERVLDARRRVRELERSLVSHRAPAEELNEDLRKYLGHGGIVLEPEETGYSILNRGEGTANLSEGERTAIALLYFLKSLGDERFDLEQGVVVLDDPVSSLDDNALFAAFGFIRERTRRAGQLIILTHNFNFFRLVRNWFMQKNVQARRQREPEPAEFFMLERTIVGGAMRAVLTILDPLLRDFESDYQYLFSRIAQEAESSESRPLEYNYAFPNMARRLLESFLAFRQPGNHDGLSSKMARVDYDPSAKARIVGFVHGYSHLESPTIPALDMSLLAETRPILREVLSLMTREDEKHVEAMRRLIG